MMTPPSLAKNLQDSFDYFLQKKSGSNEYINQKMDYKIGCFVNDLISHGIELNASDIHLEPQEHQMIIRFRIDGMLKVVGSIPKEYCDQIISKLKIMAQLDIAQNKLPQDGKFKLENIDLRISSCPTLFGEKLVTRILPSNHSLLDIEKLGMNKSQLATFKQSINSSQGMVVITGPTGSGKTNTNYAALNYLNTPERNLHSIEDPIEINLPGINQVNINPKAGLSFEVGLRSFLRQDPDIIMIGEIRDATSAEIAIKAAQTGHLIFSTLHTNSTLSTLQRLEHLGISKHHILSSVKLIVAQRLIRLLCPHCKAKIKRTNNYHGPIESYVAIGCNQCNKGYMGRKAIFEILKLDDKCKQHLYNTNFKTIPVDHHALEQVALNEVIKGNTSWQEVERSIY